MAIRIPVSSLGNVEARGAGQTQSVGVMPNAGVEAMRVALPVAGVAMQQIQEARQEVDEIKFGTAMNEILAGDASDLAEAKKLQGENFINSISKIREQRAKRIEKVLGNLPDHLRSKAQVTAGHAALTFQRSVDHHLAQTTEWMKENVAKSAADEYVKHGVSSPYDKEGLASRLGNALARQAPLLTGLPPEVVDQRRKELEASGLLAQAGAMLDQGDFDSAKAIYDTHGSTMAASPQFVRFRARFDANMTANKVQTFADSVQGVPLEEALVKARKEFAGSPEALRDATQEIEHRFSVHQRARAVAQEEAAGKVLDMYQPSLPGQKAVSPSAIKRTPEWASLDSDQRHKIMDYWDRKAKEGGDGGSGLERYATFLRLTDDPKKLASMSDAQIMALAPTLGDGLAGKLLSAKREAAGDLAKLEKVSLTDLDLRGIASEYGVKTKGKMTMKDDATLGRLRDLTMDAIRAEQVGSGTPLTQPRKEEILRGLLQSVTLKRRALWDKEKPLFKVTVEDVAGDFTADEKKAAIGALVAAGVPTSPQNMAVMVERIRSRKEGK